MEIQKYTTGMIFSLDDRNYGDLDGKEYRHYYVVVGTPVENDHKNFYQCMVITSLHNKEVLETDIPIVLNGKISYINTANISSFDEYRLDDNGSFTGILVDERFITKSEMVQMLTESWMLTHWSGMSDNMYYQIRDKISRYKENFYKINSKVGEYRDSKVFNAMDAALNESGIKEQLGIGMTRVPEKVEKKENVLDKMIVETKITNFVPIEPKGAKPGKQLECSEQSRKFILKQLHEIESGKDISNCTVVTLKTFIETYEKYGPAFFKKYSRRFKGKSNPTLRNYYYSSIDTLNSILEKSISKEISGGGVKN